MTVGAEEVQQQTYDVELRDECLESSVNERSPKVGDIFPPPAASTRSTRGPRFYGSIGHHLDSKPAVEIQRGPRDDGGDEGNIYIPPNTSDELQATAGTETKEISSEARLRRVASNCNDSHVAKVRSALRELKTYFRGRGYYSCLGFVGSF